MSGSIGRGGLRRLDGIAGRIVGRFWGGLLVAAMLFVGVPLLVGTVVSQSWFAAVVMVVSGGLALLLVRHLFSRDRRLTDFE